MLLSDLNLLIILHLSFLRNLSLQWPQYRFNLDFIDTEVLVTIGLKFIFEYYPK